MVHAPDQAVLTSVSWTKASHKSTHATKIASRTPKKNAPIPFVCGSWDSPTYTYQDKLPRTKTVAIQVQAWKFSTKNTKTRADDLKRIIKNIDKDNQR